MTYAILRQSGRSAERYRLILTGGDLERLTARYLAERRELRQGTVELLTSTGLVLSNGTAPRLRTRW